MVPISGSIAIPKEMEGGREWGMKLGYAENHHLYPSHE